MPFFKVIVPSMAPAKSVNIIANLTVSARSILPNSEANALPLETEGSRF